MPNKTLYNALDTAIAVVAQKLVSWPEATKATALAHGVLKTMTLTNLSLAAFALVTTAVAGTVAITADGSSPTHYDDKYTRPIAELVQQSQIDKDIRGDPLPAGAVARLGTTRWHHGNLVRFAAFLPDGKSAISISQDEIIHIWDCASGKELRVFGPGTQDEIRYLRKCNDAALAPNSPLNKPVLRCS